MAGGEHCANSVLFKQLLASGALGFVQPDATRLGSINECIAVLLLANKFNGAIQCVYLYDSTPDDQMRSDLILYESVNESEYKYFLTHMNRRIPCRFQSKCCTIL